MKTALAYTVDSRVRTSILATMGGNCETNLGDDAGALDAYRQNFESRESIGAADEFRSVHNAARILARQGKFAESLKTLGRVDVENLRGYWRHATLLVLGDTLAAAGRKVEALAAYQQVLADKDARDTMRQAAQQAVDELKR